MSSSAVSPRRSRSHTYKLCVLLLLSASIHAAHAHAQKGSDSDWPAYGGGLSAQHYSPRTQISKQNVKALQPAWTFHTHVFDQPGAANARAAFEANPVLWDKKLYLDTPFDEVFALDAEHGTKLWSFDPKVDRNATIGIVASRGVAMWHSAKRLPKQAACESDRVFVATLDRRLIALDASTGKVCEGFGRAGAVNLAESLHLKDVTWYEFTSPPTVVGDVVVLGSSVGDNQRIEEPSGAIRGFDARTGKLLWTFEPLPWAKNNHLVSGSGGVWSVISADPQLGLIYLPTGSPSLDFYAVNRPGDDRDANSVVALEAKTGKRVWGFQVVHHDIWDYDVAAEPLLFTFRNKIPAIAITTKMGMVFVLDRRTGEPLYPVEERPVPQSNVPGEHTSPTQPFSTLPQLLPFSMSPEDVSGKTPADRQFCHDKLAGLVNQGIYTPIGLKATLLYPGSIGGVNWGSPAFDPKTGVLYANVNHMAYDTRLVPREEYQSPGKYIRKAKEVWNKFIHNEKDIPVERRFRAPDAEGVELSSNLDSPYLLFREALLSPSGLPCSPTPWGELVALDLNKGQKLWSVPLGTMIPGKMTGSVSVGGPTATASGLIFTAATTEPLLRAFDAGNGQVLWEGQLPAPAQSTPTTYQIGAHQFVVICAGGHGAIGTQQGDSVIAFAIPGKSKR